MSEFDQKKYIQKWTKENMGQVKAQYKKSFVTDFKESCDQLGMKQSDVIREAMTSVIAKAKKEKYTMKELQAQKVLDELKED